VPGGGLFFARDEAFEGDGVVHARSRRTIGVTKRLVSKASLVLAAGQALQPFAKGIGTHARIVAIMGAA